jgi:UDP-N-acetylglucosamine diphosphorylase / glucose-1-phosphate thymidylyltransferase / UDP-N-acetylgalactosamine diphosphorylase / glucosamine-1-phosphate N-acetyltransferase / galactosamine-1-phosphate N-acetyltransferase
MSEKVDAVILAGGRGVRMGPLTLNTPKPLLHIDGRPLLEWVILGLLPLIQRVVVVVGYHSNQIERYLATQNLLTDYKVVRQPSQLGTGDALHCAEDYVGTQQFLVQNGDDLFSRTTMERLAAASLGVLTVWRDDPERWGVVVSDESGRIRQLDEKPPKGKYPVPARVNAGAYKLDRSIFQKQLTLSSRGELELTDYVTDLCARAPVYPVDADAWIPIGAPDELAKANELDIAQILGYSKIGA